MKSILCLFDYGPAAVTQTGFATVARNIVEQLKNHYGSELCLRIVAINYFGEPYREYNDTVEVVSAVNSTPPGQEPDPFGRLVFLQALKEGNYDGIFIIDLAPVASIVPHIEMIRREKEAARKIIRIKMLEAKQPIDEKKLMEDIKDFRSIIYFPVDGPIQDRVRNPEFDRAKYSKVPREMKEYLKEYICQLDELEKFDMAVTYTRYGLAEILKHKPYFHITGKVQVIYHGTNTKDFFPLSDQARAKFRRTYFEGHENKYIIGVINRNQPRKDIPTAILGFIEAKKAWNKQYPAPLLYLHMHPEDPKGWDLKKLMDQLGLVENRDYMFPKKADENFQVDVATLNNIYNALDLYLSTSRGEGWGLTVTEAMACMVPCILPNNTSLAEIGADDRAYLLQDFIPICDVSDNVKREMCHYEEVGEAIITMSHRPKNSGQLTDMVDNALRFVRENTWEAVCKEWIEFFDMVYFKNKKRV